MFDRKLNMDSIFHEKQEGSLCAQHCLNNLLQGEYFTPVDLSSIAHQLDEEERMRMAEGGMASEEYRTFLQQPSGNMDDSGFFSIQVISNALRVWGLELILFNSREYQSLMINPINEQAFICNYKEHWFTIRKLGQQWFNLNSLLTGPELISDTYLALFLAQLQQEGYSIFVIRGNLPECEAEQILGIMRVQQQQRPRLIGEDEAQTSAGRSATLGQTEVGFGVEDEVLDEDEELKRALALSRQDIDVEDEEADLRRAIQLSMQGAVMSNKASESEMGNVKSGSQVAGSSTGGQRDGQNEKLTAEELRKRRQAYFDRQQQQAQSNIPQQPDTKSSGGSDRSVIILMSSCAFFKYLLMSTCLPISGCAPKPFQTQNMAAHKMKMGFIFIVTYMCFLAPGHQAHLPSATISDLSFKNMDFAMNLYRKISSYHDKNIFFSPLSVSTSFAALLLASDGITRKEILKGLNLEQLDRAEQPELIPKLFQLLNENITQNGSLKLDQSMVLLTSQQFAVEKNTEQQIKLFFDADIKSVNFADTKPTIHFINEYIRQTTQNKVTEMISDLDSRTKLMLINTIFFQGAWEKPFNSNLTENAPFYIDNYSVVDVPMMFKEDKFYTMEDVLLGAKVLKLPYQEGVSMLILLPNKGTDYNVIDDEISAEKFLSWISRLYKTKLEVNMPKFKMEQSYSLHNLLPDMGMASVFSNAANLTKLSKEEGLKVSEVLHKAVIEVDETGTTAAAATTVGITPYSLPRTFTVNRPFFFFIYHEDTHCLLFMGRVIDPTK
ncbi:hypothetical protein L3Q82_026575 [Scortum barcoo]|uniref:Uncharacterized protein n=1 Tax=Scortum barcoo TaxID=214431 RepID=A0ACB8WIF8_9TELE|nr:hypothetical protein L3Q82_026575 [Scortum barcoo]